MHGRDPCREGEGFVLVYSITARATFERIERFRHQITRVKDSDSIPIVLVGNKSDRANEREVGKEEGAALAKRLGCEFVETSAKTRSNLEHAYYQVVRKSALLPCWMGWASAHTPCLCSSGTTRRIRNSTRQEG